MPVTERLYNLHPDRIKPPRVLLYFTTSCQNGENKISSVKVKDVTLMVSAVGDACEKQKQYFACRRRKVNGEGDVSLFPLKVINHE